MSAVASSHPSPENAGESPQIVVVGGGLAGIATSLKLAKDGYQVRLLEAKRRLGGRAGSFTMPGEAGPEEIDYCQHVAMGCCHNLKTLIGWLGLENAWEVHRELHFYGAQGAYRRLRALPWLPAPFHLAAWLLKWPDLSLTDRFSIAQLLLKLARLENRASWDDVSAQTWLLEQGQSTRAIANFWSTIVVSALGEETERVSLQAVVKVLQDGFLRERDAFHVLVPRLPLAHMFHETALKTLQAAGVATCLSNSVHKLSAGTDRQTIGVHTTRPGKDSVEKRNAAAVVLALPWYRIPNLELTDFPSLETLTNQARELKSSPITGIHIWWDRRWLTQPHAALVGRLCQWVFPKYDGDIEAREEFYTQIVISASRSLSGFSPSQVAQRVQDDLAEVFPEVRAARLLRIKVVTDPHSVFSVAPGVNKLRPQSHQVGPIYCAGDWTQTGWPATMEGAVLSGFQAAQSIAERVPRSGA